MRFDAFMGLLSVVLVGGFYLDLWAHRHGRVDESFLTPWHGVLYAGAGIFCGVLLARRLGGRSDPPGGLPAVYRPALVGALVFLGAGVLDLVWHSVLGIEEDTSALLSPPHLLLAASGVLMVSGPVRSSWTRPASGRFPDWVPSILAVTMLLSILTAFTQYAHPAVDVWPGPFDTGSVRSTLLMIDADEGTSTRIPLDIGDDVWAPAYHPSGAQVVVSVATGESGAIHMVDPAAGETEVLWEGPGGFHHPAVSPDGRSLAFNADPEPGNAEVFVMDLGTGEVTQVTSHPARDWGAAWSPDGSRLAFASDRAEGRNQIFDLSLGDGTIEQLTDLPGDARVPVWSPDGSRLAVEVVGAAGADVFVVESDGSGATPLTGDEGYDAAPAWSPDGESIVFASDRDGDFEVYRMNADGTGVSNLTRNPAADDGWGRIAWSPDGSTLVTNTAGWPRADQEPFVREALGMASLLIQSALVAGVVLLLLRHGPIPAGALTVILTVNAALMGVLADNHWYVVPAAAAGIIGDLINQATTGMTSARQARILGAAVPCVGVAGYLVAVAVTQGGWGWTIHMVLGAPLLAGTVGLLLGFLAFPEPAPADALV